MLTVTYFISALSFRLWMPYFSLYALELGATKEMLGVLSTIQAFSLMLSQLPGGLLADRLGRKRTIIVFGVFEVLTPLSYQLARSWPHLIFGAVSQSVGWACMPAINSIVVESIPGKDRGTGLGVYRFITWLPRMFMQFIGGVILDATGLIPGFRVILAWSTIASILILVTRARGLQETLVVADREDLSRGESEGSSLLKLPRSIWAMIAVGGLSSFAVRMTMEFLVVYAVEVIGLTKTGWGLITMITGVVSTSLNTFGGILSDRIGRKPCILASRLIEPLTTLGLTSTRSFTGAMLLQVFKGIGNGVGGGLIMKGLMMGGPAWEALVADIIPTPKRGRIMGVLGTAQSLIALPSPWLGGYLWDNHYPEAPFHVSALIGIAAPIILHIYVKEPEKNKVAS